MEIRKLKDDELQHHGVKDQKWGVRRYQNQDGSLTPLGRQHYGYGDKVRNRIEKEATIRKKSGINKKDSAEITMRQVRREKRVQNAVTGAVGASAIGAGLRNIGRAQVRASAMNFAARSFAARRTQELKSAASLRAMKNGVRGVEYMNASNAVPAIAPLVTSAVSSMNPILLSVAASAAVTMTGYALYNTYKNYKLSQISDEYQLPDSKRVRHV